MSASLEPVFKTIRISGYSRPVPFQAVTLGLLHLRFRIRSPAAAASCCASGFRLGPQMPRMAQVIPAGPIVLHAKVCGRVGRRRHK